MYVFVNSDSKMHTTLLYKYYHVFCVRIQ